MSPTISLLLIGSELTSGKRQDKHFGKMIEILGCRSLEPAECVIIGDDPARITSTLRRFMDNADLAFSFGGIGATPDDLTRQCAAEAAGVPLARHPQAVAILKSRFGEDAYPQRIRMAELPDTCSLIPNPVNQIPGFSVGDTHFVPGFPQMAWPMVQWVLDEHYPELFGQELTEHRLLLPNAKEGDIAELLHRISRNHPSVRVSSLPHMSWDMADSEDHHSDPWIELGVKGIPEQAHQAFLEISDGLRASGFSFRVLEE